MGDTILLSKAGHTHELDPDSGGSLNESVVYL